MKYLIAIVTLAPLILAAIIYTAFRGDCCFASAFVTQFLGESGAKVYVSNMQETFHFSTTNINSLPAALWVFSTSFMSSRITSNKTHVWKILVLLPLAYALGLETMQYYGLTDGTFDTNDIIYTIMGWSVSILFAKTFDLSGKQIQFSTYSLVVFYGILFLANGM